MLIAPTLSLLFGSQTHSFLQQSVSKNSFPIHARTATSPKDENVSLHGC